MSCRSSSLVLCLFCLTLITYYLALQFEATICHWYHGTLHYNVSLFLNIKFIFDYTHYPYIFSAVSAAGDHRIFRRECKSSIQHLRFGTCCHLISRTVMLVANSSSRALRLGSLCKPTHKRRLWEFDWLIDWQQGTGHGKSGRRESLMERASTLRQPFIYSVCQKVTPFWYLSFLPLLDALYLQFLFTYISFSLNACYQSQVSSVPMDSPAGWCTIAHCEKHDKLPQKGECFIHRASLPQIWPPNSPDLNPVGYAVWGALQQQV